MSGSGRSRLEMMRTDLELRRRRLKIAGAGSDTICITGDDRTLCCPRGERMRRDEFDHLPGGRHGMIVIDEEDTRL